MRRPVEIPLVCFGQVHAGENGIDLWFTSDLNNSISDQILRPFLVISEAK